MSVNTKKIGIIITAVIMCIGLTLTGCKDPSDIKEVEENVLPSQLIPVIGEVPIYDFEMGQFSGEIAWDPPIADKFLSGVQYNAIITLTAKPGLTFKGVGANTFSLQGATVANLPGTGVTLEIIVAFPTTGGSGNGGGDPPNPGDPVTITGHRLISLSRPVTGATPQTAVTATPYIGTVTWSPTPGASYAANTQYSATINLTAVTSGNTTYTFNGVEANWFQVNDATSVTHSAGTGTTLTITVVFPQTGATAPSPVRTVTLTCEDYGPTGYIRDTALLGSGQRYTANDVVTINVVFTASRDIASLSVVAVDTTAAAAYWGPLSQYFSIENIKAGVTVTQTITLIVENTASATSIDANTLGFSTGEAVGTQPVTLSFTQFNFTRTAGSALQPNQVRLSPSGTGPTGKITSDFSMIGAGGTGRFEAGDTVNLDVVFTSNRDIDSLSIAIVDCTEYADPAWWGALGDYITIQDIKAGVPVSELLVFEITKSAFDTSLIANTIGLSTDEGGSGTMAILTFTKFEYAKTSGPTPISAADILGVTAPATAGIPVSEITEVMQYSGMVTWSPPVIGGFDPRTQYTATITLTPKLNFITQGIPQNFFKVAGATATNPANSAVITAVFPATGGSAEDPDPVTIFAIQGITAPVAKATAVTSITENTQYTGIVTWSPSLTAGTFDGMTVYTATITLSTKLGYTLAGTVNNAFTVAGATSVTYAAGSNTITAAFPETEISYTLIGDWVGSSSSLGLTMISSLPSSSGNRGVIIYPHGAVHASYTSSVTGSRILPVGHQFREGNEYRLEVEFSHNEGLSRVGFSLASLSGSTLTFHAGSSSINHLTGNGGNYVSGSVRRLEIPITVATTSPGPVPSATGNAGDNGRNVIVIHTNSGGNGPMQMRTFKLYKKDTNVYP